MSDAFDALHLFVIGCGVIDQLAMLGKARAVARAIPGMLGGIILERTAEVRTARCGRGKKPYGGRNGIDDQLRMQDGA